MKFLKKTHKLGRGQGSVYTSHEPEDASCPVSQITDNLWGHQGCELGLHSLSPSISVSSAEIEQWKPTHVFTLHQDAHR